MCLSTETSSSSSFVSTPTKKRRAPNFHSSGNNVSYFRRPTMLPPPITTTTMRPSSPGSIHEISEEESPHVSFQEGNNQVFEINTMLSLAGRGEQGNLWYSSNDIRGFKNEAIDISEKMVREPDSCSHIHARGLEVRMSPERQQVKSLIVRRVLEAQDDDCDAAELAEISMKVSTASKVTAKVQGHRDFLSVYHPNLTSVFPALDRRRDSSRLGKRSLEQQHRGTGRRVKVRMF